MASYGITKPQWVNSLCVIVDGSVDILKFIENYDGYKATM